MAVHWGGRPSRWSKAPGVITPAATTWNPADKAAGVTLSNGDLTATFAASDGAVRSTNSHSTGKWYYEIQPVDITNDAFPAIGFADATFILDASYLGYDTHGIGALPSTSFMEWAVYIDGEYGDPPYLTYTAGAKVGMAIDIDAGLMWISSNGVFLGDPVAGTGGRDIATVCTGEVFACIGTAASAGAIGPVNFGATAFSYAAPTGFSAWGA